MPSTKLSTHVFLVHGVGLPTEDLFGRELAQKLLTIGVLESNINRIDWHQCVELPYVDVGSAERPFKVINFSQIAGLIRGLVGAATLPGPRNFWLSRFAYSLLHTMMIFAPLMMLWSVFLTAKLVSSAGGLAASLVDPIIELGKLLFGPALSTLSWVPRTYLGAIEMLVAAVVLVHTAEDGAPGVRAGIRKSVACLAWPFVYFVALCASWFGAIYGALYVIIFTTDLALRLLDQVTITPKGVVVAGVSMNAMFMASLPGTLLSVLAILSILLGARLLMWCFKVFADVMRFAGDPTYAAALVRHVSAQLSKPQLKANDTVVIVGHSLGSAICLNCLLDRPALFPRTARIFLVTMGSPITRLLARFFPGIMPNAGSAAEQLRARYGEFRWINVYRPFDPIGGAIFSRLDKRPFTRDISTKQYRKVLFTAHTRYWDDDAVIQGVRRAIVESIDSDQMSSQPTDREWIPAKAGRQSPPILRMNRFLGRSLWIRTGLAVGMAALLIFNMAILIHNQMAHSNTPLLGKSSVTTDDAWLYRYYETNPNAGQPGSVDQLPMDFYVVTFRPIGAAKPIAKRVDPLAIRGRLEDVFATKGQAATLAQRGAIFDMPATRVHIPVRYLANDPDIFDFPTLRPKSFSDSAIYEFAVLWYALFMMIFLVGPLVLWLVPLYFGRPTVPFAGSLIS